MATRNGGLEFRGNPFKLWPIFGIHSLEFKGVTSFFFFRGSLVEAEQKALPPFQPGEIANAGTPVMCIFHPQET